MSSTKQTKQTEHTPCDVSRIAKSPSGFPEAIAEPPNTTSDVPIAVALCIARAVGVCPSVSGVDQDMAPILSMVTLGLAGSWFESSPPHTSTLSCTRVAVWYTLGLAVSPWYTGSIHCTTGTAQEASIATGWSGSCSTKCAECRVFVRC